MKDKYIKLKAILLAGTIALTSAGLSGCSTKDNDRGELITIETYNNYSGDRKKLFGVGEHIISVRVKGNPINSVRQYEYHDGYKVVGMSTSALGFSYSGTCLIYENEYPVECSSNKKDANDNYVYSDFGQPIDFSRNETEQRESIKEFNAGEHIISVPINDPTKGAMQYQYHEGYEVVGIAAADYSRSHAGACVLYVNKQPVACTLTEIEDGKELYLSFGVPVEKEMTKSLN